MKFKELDDKMRAKETFHAQAVDENKWIILRVDGRSFSTVTRDFQKPFDPNMAEWMTNASKALLEAFEKTLFAYAESDEISLLLRHDFDLFKRSHEKLVSLSASTAAASFSIDYGKPVQFDSRVWIGDNIADVVDYFSWRHADARRCGLNSALYWYWRSEGISGRKANSMAKGMGRQEKEKILREAGKPFENYAAESRCGVNVKWRVEHFEGYNPVSETTVDSVRNIVTASSSPERSKDQRKIIESLFQ